MAFGKRKHGKEDTAAEQGDVDGARAAFQQAVGTGRTELREYRAAKSF